MTTLPRKFWRHLSKPDSSIRKMEINGIVTENAHAIVNSFNAFFQSVFTQASPVRVSTVAWDSAMPEIEITDQGVLSLLLQLDVKKSPGPYKIPTAFLKRYAEQLTPFLFKIFVLSLKNAALRID